AVSPIARLDPREAMHHLKSGASAYAEGAVAEYLGSNVPGLTLTRPGDPHPGGELILYALPAEADLRMWVTAGRVAFAFGPKTLAELEGALTRHHLAPPPINPLLDATQDDAHLEKAADAYRRWQWAHHHRTLDDAGWTASVHAMLGLELPETVPPELAVADD
ncbi:MAG: single-stranded exonuclease RecJ, partial [Deinococcus sp.]|nr:single-stranded exonuclease RecJ [Deinococcus sp.]